MLVRGVVLVAMGTLLFASMSRTAGLIFAIGVLAAGGAGMAGPSVLTATTTRLVAPERRALASGVVNAGGSFGQFSFAPLAQAVTMAAGWAAALQTLGLVTLLALPLAWVLRAPPAVPAAANGAPRLGTRAAIRVALADRSYRLLATGFFVGGFHVAFLGTHLPGGGGGLRPAAGGGPGGAFVWARRTWPRCSAW